MTTGVRQPGFPSQVDGGVAEQLEANVRCCRHRPPTHSFLPSSINRKPEYFLEILFDVVSCDVEENWLGVVVAVLAGMT